jgi:hypothetical protein
MIAPIARLLQTKIGRDLPKIGRSRMRRCFFSFCDCLSKAGYLLADCCLAWNPVPNPPLAPPGNLFGMAVLGCIFSRWVQGHLDEATCRQQTHANDRWAQVKLQSCGGGRSATATQRRKESSASSCTICTMMQSCCAVEDDGRRIVFAAAPPVAAASRFSWTQPSWAHWAAFKSILRSRRVGSARTRAVEAAYGS